ncbi:MAG TPA: plastocyanin/azurin family copper-binding protein [Acidimicrobiales bacterium]|nr:plastocyanin/azurin family copper-binding protein [Acidimicrobiales bacterium]
MNHNTATHTRSRGRHALVAAFALSTLGLLGACGGSDGGQAGGETAVAPQNAVTMQLIAFKPATVTVDAGATVTWTQKDPGVHTVTSGAVEQGGGGVSKVPDGRFDSGEIATGAAFTFTFDQPGTYPYFCSVHPATMRGEVRVR